MREPEHLADTALKPVALMRVPITGGDSQPEARLGKARFEPVNTDRLADQPLPLFGKPPELGPGGQFITFWEGQAASDLRPARRRRLITFLPPAVFIRVLKPWVFLRLILLGW